MPMLLIAIYQESPAIGYRMDNSITKVLFARFHHFDKRFWNSFQPHLDSRGNKMKMKGIYENESPSV